MKLVLDTNVYCDYIENQLKLQEIIEELHIIPIDVDQEVARVRDPLCAIGKKRQENSHQ